MTLFVGIDPGLSGAIAVLDENGALISIEPIPLVPSGSGSRSEFDLPAIRDRLLHWRTFASRSGLFVTIEKLTAMPRSMGGASANFARGLSRGFAWMLTVLEVPYQLVSPREWQSAMLAGAAGKDTKQRSIVAAQRLFPSADLRRSPKSKKPDDGLADAALLAEFGRRSREGVRKRDAA